MKTLDDLYQEVDALADEAFALWAGAKRAFGDRQPLLDVLIELRSAFDHLDDARSTVERLMDEEEADQ